MKGKLMCGEIQSDESKQREWGHTFDAIIETCELKTQETLRSAIQEKDPHMFNIDYINWDDVWKNRVALNRINLAIKKAKKSPVQTNLI